MPIYEYQCSNCEQVSDVIQKFSDPVLTNCEQCNTDTLVKLVSAPSFQLKGTGWYATDFKNSGKPKTAVTSSKSTDSKSANTSTKNTQSNVKSNTTNQSCSV